VRIVVFSLTVLEEHATGQAGRDDLLLLHVEGDFGCEAAEHDDVWADDFVFAGSFGAVVVVIFIVDIVEFVDPTLVVHRNEVDEFVGEDEHGVG